MKNKECEIVKDLLPSYIDGLTSEESNEFIEEHMKSCEDCRDIYEIMKNDTSHKYEDKKVVNYLKKIKKKNMYSYLFISLFFISMIIFMIISYLDFKDSHPIVVKDDELIGVAVFESEDDIIIHKNSYPIMMVNSLTNDGVIKAEYEEGQSKPKLIFEKNPIAYYGLYVSSNNLSKNDSILLPFGNDKFYDAQAVVRDKDNNVMEHKTTIKLDVDKNSKKMLEIYNIFKRKDGTFYAIQTGLLTNYTEEVSAQVGYYNFKHLDRETQYIFNIIFIPK